MDPVLEHVTVYATKHAVGLGLGLVGLVMILSSILRARAVVKRRRAEAALGLPDPNQALNPKLALMGEALPPLVNMMLFLAAALLCAHFFVTGGSGGKYTYIELGGVLLALLGFGLWQTLRTSYRYLGDLSKPLPTPSPAGPAAPMPAEPVVEETAQPAAEPAAALDASAEPVAEPAPSEPPAPPSVEEPQPVPAEQTVVVGAGVR